MPRIRSLITTVELDIAKRTHECQGNSAHRLSKGDRRLAVKKDRGWDYYCIDCGRRILERDASKIASVLQAMEVGRTASAHEVQSAD